MSPIRPESLSWVKRVKLDGKLKVNNRLANGKTASSLIRSLLIRFLASLAGFSLFNSGSTWTDRNALW